MAWHPFHTPEERRREPLITLDKGPVMAALVTGATSLLLYSFTTVHMLDARIDKLEEQMSELMDNEGRPRPSERGTEAYYNVQRLEQRINDMEKKLTADLESQGVQPN